MSDRKLILVGGAIGLVAFAVYQYFFAFNGNAGIDPTTGATTLPAGSTFGPPVVDDGQTAAVTPGPIVEGLQ